jgi:opacity protein-like surface antigen
VTTLHSADPRRSTGRRTALPRRAAPRWLPLALAILFVSPAAADDDEDPGTRSYFQFQSGVSHIPNQTLDGNAGTGAVQPDEIGILVGGAFGHYFTDMLRGEFAVTYRQGDVDQGGFPGSSQADGKTSLLAFMLNVYADLPLGVVTPWIGAGIGAGSYKIDVFQKTAGAFDVDDEDAVFVYNAMVGTSFALNEVTSLDVGYRYIAIAGDQDTDAIVGATPSTLDSEFDAHEATVGIRFSF